MKKIFTLLFVSSFLFTACSDGDTGPQGPPGEDGLDGTGYTLEFENINFNSQNDFRLTIGFNDEGIEVFEDDAILVYLKDGDTGIVDGRPVNVYRLLPQTYYTDNGQVSYNYDFTFENVQIFMEGTADLENLDPEFTQNVTLRVVVVPSAFLTTNNTIDIQNYDAVSKALDIKESSIQNIKIQQ